MPELVRRQVEVVQLGEVSPLLQRIYASRGIHSPDQLEYRLDRLLPYTELLNIDHAAQRLFDAIKQQQRVLIIGDYDADGATSCAVGMRALSALGLHNVDYLVPSRFAFGYGLTAGIVEVAARSKPDLIITVDNGIASIDGVNVAKSLGIEVMITDHHLAGSELPDADVIVNPNQPGDVFPSKCIAGVGVVFYIMLALRALMRDAGWFEQQAIAEPNLAELLDIVALGTVADVVRLDENNRILVEQGIRRMRAGKACSGISALAKVSGRDIRFLKSSDLGFSLAPRLNAAGRLEDMSLGIECLITDDPERAALIAEQLNEINLERRAISQEMQQEAEDMLDSLSIDMSDHKALSLYQPHWHQGVIGILAGRIKDRFYRPTIVFAPGDNGELKGSARSIPGFHIRDALEAVDSQHRDLIVKFGGHAMAAGLTIMESNFQQFADSFNVYADSVLNEQDLTNVVYTDGALQEQELTMNTALSLDNGGPWGQGFPEPLFEGNFMVLEQRRIGADRNHVKLLLGLDGSEVDAIAFNQEDSFQPVTGDPLEITYRLSINRYRGFENLQLIVQDVLTAKETT